MPRLQHNNTDTNTTDLSTTDRLFEAAERGVRRVRRRVTATYSWARRQNPKTLVSFLGLSAAAFVAAYMTLRLIVGLIAGLWNWLFGDSEAASSVTDREPPRWISDLPNYDLWPSMGHHVAGWVQHLAAPTGIPAWVVVVTWSVVGLALVLPAAVGGETRSTVAWWGWLGVTCWVIWQHTPGGNPVPAGLVAAVGVLVSAVPLWLFSLATMVVVAVAVLGA